MKEHRWISVDKEMPPYYKSVLVAAGKQVFCTWLATDGEKYIWTISNGNQVLSVTVTHWMPLPELP
jgi:hypothetical protein